MTFSKMLLGKMTLLKTLSITVLKVLAKMQLKAEVFCCCIQCSNVVLLC
jgi:hypothetical protein